MFPNISLGEGETLKFDRILADVPYVHVPALAIVAAETYQL
jgi:hypothetical protein